MLVHCEFAAGSKNFFLCALWSDILLDYYLLQNEYDDVFCPKKLWKMVHMIIKNDLHVLNFVYIDISESTK
jgi:hypothetical protein